MRRGSKGVRYLLFIFVLYMIFTVSRLAYKNYQLNLQEEQLRSDVIALENEIQDLKNKIVYFQSDSYKEKMIRAKLGMKKEGEVVVVITPAPGVDQISETETKNLNNPQKWLRYFFGNI